MEGTKNNKLYCEEHGHVKPIMKPVCPKCDILSEERQFEKDFIQVFPKAIAKIVLFTK